MKTLQDILPLIAGKKNAANLTLGVHVLYNAYSYLTANEACKTLNPRNITIKEDPTFSVDEIIRDDTQKMDYRYCSNHYIETGEWDEDHDSIFTMTVILYYLFSGHLPWNIDDTIEQASVKKQKQAVLNARKTQEVDMSQIPPFARKIIEYGLTPPQVVYNYFVSLYCRCLQNELRGSGMVEWLPDPDDKFKLDDLCITVRDLVAEFCFDEESIEFGNNLLNLCNMNDNQSKTDTNMSFEEQKALYARCGVAETFQFKRGDGTNGLNKVAGMEDLKESMRNEVLFPLLHPELSREYRLHITNGLLLYGPPGCGKSFFAEHFANEGAMSYCMIKASEISSSYVHGTQLLIQQLFDQAKHHTPCVICLDEIDSMCPRRRDFDIKVAAETNTFLSELNNVADSGIFVIGTTNRPDIIDTAVLRSGRFDKKIYVPAPDAKARGAIFEIELRERPLASDIDCQELGEKSENFIASDISAAVNSAALEAARKHDPISQALLLKHIEKTNPSLTEESKKEYERIHDKMDNHQSNKHARIGFY